jgi:hypothetical protein
MEQFDESQSFIDNLILIVTNKISSKHNQEDIINLKHLKAIKNSQLIQQRMLEDLNYKYTLEQDEDIQNSSYRRGRVNFRDLGIKVGYKLYFKDDMRYTCTVSSDNKVIYNGEEMSLSRAARLVCVNKGFVNVDRQGTIYWTFKNEKILDMMNRIYDTIPHEHYSQIQKSSAN